MVTLCRVATFDKGLNFIQNDFCLKLFLILKLEYSNITFNVLTFITRHVSGFVTASRQRFVMLHDVKNEDGIKSFFSEMYEVRG